MTLLSLGFSRQEDWSGLPFPPLGPSALSILKECTRGCFILKVDLQGWSGVGQAGSLGLWELDLRLGRENRPVAGECQGPGGHGSQPGSGVGQNLELVLADLMLGPDGTRGSRIDRLGAFGAGRCQGGMGAWVQGSPQGA